MAPGAPGPYVDPVLSRLLSPWRTTATWRLLVHAVLDLPMGLVCSLPAIVLTAVSFALLPVLPLAVIPFLLLLRFSWVVGYVERSRYLALHRVEIANPILRTPPGSLWRRFRSLLTSKARWKGIAYCLLRLPAGVLAFLVVVLSWAGSLALLGLPFYRLALPDNTARFWLFEVNNPGVTLLLGLLGLASLVLIAPWVTVLVGHVDRSMARFLLGPAPGDDLKAEVVRAETGRTAAIEAAEAERRRIERDLHDGAQQRLVALAMDLGTARERFDEDPAAAKQLVIEAHEEAKAALKEIRDLVRGIHPVILEDRGLDAALSAVIARSPVPVNLTVDLPGRMAPEVESAAYFVISEALTNVARHAKARRAHVGVVRSGPKLVIEVRDDGVGGADPGRGSGLNGLGERVTSLGGTMDLLSPLGGPTTLLVELPCAS